MRIRQQPSIEDIKTEIIQRFGFLPSFFTPALSMPQLLETLWQQTSAYLDNPLPAHFKEQLAAYLSRYCRIPYCVIIHSCRLHTLNISAQEILSLLAMPLPNEREIERALILLNAEATPLSVWPERSSELEHALLTCAIHIFLQPEQVASCRHTLEHLLRQELYQHLLAFFGYVKMAHFWVESHPELSYEDDLLIHEHLHTLLEEEPTLAHIFQEYGQGEPIVQQEQHLISEREQGLVVQEERRQGQVGVEGKRATLWFRLPLTQEIEEKTSEL